MVGGLGAGKCGTEYNGRRVQGRDSRVKSGYEIYGDGIICYLILSGWNDVE